MRWQWGMFICGVLLGTAAGFVTGHVTAWSRAETRAAIRASAAAMPASAMPVVSGERNAHPGDEPVFFPQPPVTGTTIHADATLDAARDRSPAAQEPATLPQPDAAAPLSANGERALRSLLEAELPDLPAGDRDVWLDVLQGLPPQDALGILRLWKRFGSIPPALSRETPVATPLVPAPSPTSAPPLAVPATEAGPESDAVNARTSLEAARRIVLNNLLNGRSIGFRRTEPLFSEPASAVPTVALASDDTIPADALQPAPAVQLIGTRLDQTPGELLATAGPIDMAIDGEGYFAVGDEGAPYFTRCGRFTRDDRGRLALQTARGALPVQPELVIPADAAAVLISPEGDVAIVRDGCEPERIGALRLALFVAPDQLCSLGDALLAPTARSGDPCFGPPDGALRGRLLSRRLESSNVDAAEEMALLRQIENWLDLMDE